MLTRKDLRLVVVIGLFTLAILLILDKLTYVGLVIPQSITEEGVTDSKKTLLIRENASVKPPVIVEAVSSLPNTNILELHTSPAAAISNPTTLPPNQQCSPSIKERYSSAGSSLTFGNDLKWCKETIKRDNVVIGRSWGRMSKGSQLRWDAAKCNELLSLGKLQTCDQRWGWASFDDWLSNSKTIVSGISNVTCVVNIKTSTFCQHGHVVVDFSKLAARERQRTFAEGFLTTFGSKHTHSTYPRYPGYKHVPVSEGSSSASFNLSDRCDHVETRPTFVLSNDDIYNLGHYFNDVMGTWSMLVLANKRPQSALLVNIDGIRPGGPAGGPAHRLMEPGAPDTHGPFNGYFQSWFGEVKKGVDYGRKKVCFRELYFPVAPGVPWFWNDWGQINDCSLQAASPLYQSFNMFLRQSWREKYGADSLVSPPTDSVHIVIEVRSINKAKTNNHSAARHITNLNQLIAALETIPGVRVTAQDFAKLSFSQQVSLSHSASVFVSMHGAGTTHIFHSAVGEPNCCALVELFPDESIEFHTAHGYGNIARMLGMHHYRAVAPRGSTKAKGTAVSVEHIRSLVVQAVEAVKSKPTCLHDVKDTNIGVYGDRSIFANL